MSGSQINQPIGVFDSGVGGLTVLKALMQKMPQESFVYLGDTARLPYGTKSAETVIQYALRGVERLLTYNVKAVVLACNTASSVAVPQIEKQIDIPVFDVVNPGSNAACKATKHKEMLVLSTERTLQERAYKKAIERLMPDARVYQVAAPLLVALAEEGWREGSIVEQILQHYLSDLWEVTEKRIDVIVLGCTHFPLFTQAIKHLIARVLRADVQVIDSSSTTAEYVAKHLAENARQEKASNSTITGTTNCRFLVTDSPERFERVGLHFLGETVQQGMVVEKIDL